MSKAYRFRADDGTEIEVDFETMMNQKDGYIKVEGQYYKRVHDTHRIKRREVVKGAPRQILSDNLGFGQHQFTQMEEDRSRNGFQGVEFVRDKDVPEFFQVKCDSPRTWERYAKHRGFFDKNSKNGSGACLTEHDFKKAQEKIQEKYGKID